MPTYQITSPEGEKFKVTAPENASESQVMEYFKSNYSKPQSAITGKPVPTGVESGEQAIEGTKNIIKGAAPIVGDLAFTALAPQFSIPAKVGKLGNMGFKALNLALRGGASAAGSAGGMSVGNQITGEQSSAEDVKKEALLGVGGEVVTSGLGATAKITKKVFKPIFEKLPDITFAGSAVKNYYNQTIKKQATERAENFLLDIAPKGVKSQAGKEKNLSVMVSNAFADNSAVFDLYKGAIKEASEKEGGVILVDDTAQLIGEKFLKAKQTLPDGTNLQIMNEALRDMNYTPNVRKAIAEFGTSDVTSPANIEFIMANVFQNKGWNRLNPTQRAAREELKESLMADLDKLGNNVSGYKLKADEEFKALAKFNSIRRIYNQALVTADAATGRKALQPAKLYDVIFANKKKILNDPELSKIWPDIEREAIAALKTAKSIEKTSTDVGPGSIFSRGLGGAGGAFLFGPGGVPMVEGFGAASAWALLSDSEKSIMKKLFKGAGKVVDTTTRAATKAGLRLGGRELFPQDDVAP